MALVFWQGLGISTSDTIRNPAGQHQSRDVKVGDNPTAQTLRLGGPTPPTESTKIQNFFGSFGKEIEQHTIQQGSVRVNNGNAAERWRARHSDLPAIVKETKVIGVKGTDIFK
ncbi:hypothetical protein R3P38DRAFT_2814558 [Favolaschia claudopus]|uniref:Uncharacterized protein n=1 Tax=Favolaschia claudopus TaxID=2862362 RepID=A0AAV9Z4S7_9AGAR